MITFILNNETIGTDLAAGMTVLDFVRYYKNLKGTKIGCREGDCGACTILVGELKEDRIRYRTMTSCLMPLSNAAGLHIVTVEGINKPGDGLTPVQQAMVDASGTQCGFCTVGFVISLTNFCLDDAPKNSRSAISAIDGNICRCTGYKSIERASERICNALSEPSAVADGLSRAIRDQIVPPYFGTIPSRLKQMQQVSELNRPLAQTVLTRILAGGTDLYVQRHEEMVHADAQTVFFDESLRTISETDEFVEIGGSVVVSDLLESPIFNRLFPNLHKHLKLVSSTPIRNMATIAGNFANASPIGDMTAWFLALDAELDLSVPSAVADGLSRATRTIALKELYLDYKQLAKSNNELIKTIRFKKDFSHFNFEKVSKRTYLDIASVNTAIAIRSEPPNVAGGCYKIIEAHVSAGGVFKTPLYLRKTSEFLRGRIIDTKTIAEANELIQTEISPISDVRGTTEYKRLLLKQLFNAHFIELFGI